MFDVNYDFFLIENNFKEIEGVKSEKIQGDISSKLPLVSIVIPTYKRVSTLRETLDSVIRQTGNHNYEILVVDNNPERGDETELMMAEYVSVKNLLYFKNTEKRNPTITEIKVLDTYWSDHCRHTTFMTKIEDVEIEDGKYNDIMICILNQEKMFM